MTKKMLQVLALLFSLTGFAASQSTTEAGGTLRAQPQIPHPEADAKDLRSDLERMHILLEQMQRNVAFVSAGDTPLKHQFQLEIEMWQLLIRDMEKKASVQVERQAVSKLESDEPRRFSTDILEPVPAASDPNRLAGFETDRRILHLVGRWVLEVVGQI